MHPRVGAALAAAVCSIAMVSCSSNATDGKGSSASTNSGDGQTTTSTTAPAGTSAESALVRQVAIATRSTTLPADLQPSLSDVVSNPTSPALWPGLAYKACDASNPLVARNLSPCMLGDTSSTKTIALVGDSNAANYAAPLDVGLKAAGYRLELFFYSSCPAPDIEYTKLAAGSTPVSQCNQWHQNVPAAIAAANPLAMILVSAPDGTYYPQATWTGGMKRFFDQVGSQVPGMKRVLMGAIPYFPLSPPDCLSAHPSPATCSMKFSDNNNFYTKILALNRIVATASSATLIATDNWLCWKSVCPPVVGNYLAYIDHDHFTLPFSNSLMPVVTPAVLEASGLTSG